MSASETAMAQRLLAILLMATAAGCPGFPADGRYACAGADCCGNGLLDNDESDIDCGGLTCHACLADSACFEDADCASKVCSSGRCAPLCSRNNGGCDPNAACAEPNSGVRSCTCKSGFAGSGLACADVDECQTNRGGCDANATCTNLVGSHRCDCKPGYAGDGRSCADVDECLTANGGCDAHADCLNTPGSRSCSCQSGWVGDGLTCDPDVCLVNHGGCATIASCVAGHGGATCTCPSGYSGDGKSCTDIDECQTNNGGCDPHATCTNTPGSRSCSCKGGYSGDGLSCSWLGILQLGGAGLDEAGGVAVDASGNIYVVGSSDSELGKLASPKNDDDAILVKVGSDGTILWTKMLASTMVDAANGIALDSSGNLYVVGVTDGNLFGAVGVTSAFVVSYDPGGTERWHQVIDSAGQRVWGTGIAVSPLGVFVAGTTRADLAGALGGADGWAARLDPATGARVWLKQVGSSADDRVQAIAVDSSSRVHLVGSTAGAVASANAGGEDAFGICLDPDGKQVYSYQLGTAALDTFSSVTVDSSGMEIAVGMTFGSFPPVTNLGLTDVLIAFVDQTGKVRSTDQLGGGGQQAAHAVSLDATGMATVVGQTADPLDQKPIQGRDDGFVLQYLSGVRQTSRTRMVGADGLEGLVAVARGPNGTLYAVGFTDSAFPGFTNPAPGLDDLFLVRLAP